MITASPTLLRRLLPAAALLAAAAPAAAVAAPTVGAPIPLGDDAPKQLAVAADGTLWLTLDSATSDVARVQNGVVTKYNDPAVSGASGITLDPAGNVWITYQSGVASFSPADPAAMSKTPVPAIVSPRKIVYGGDGNLWTASDDKLVKLPPANPAGFTTRTIPGMSATSIAYTGDRNLWVTNFGGELLHRIPDGGGEPAQVPAGGNPQDIAAGPRDSFAVAMPSAPHRVSLRNFGGETAAPLVSGDPFGIAYAADGAYWTARFADHSVGRVTPEGQVERYAMPAASGPRYLAAGGSTVWVGLETAKAVVPITGVEPPAAPVGGGAPAPGGAGPGQGPAATAPLLSDVKLLRTRFRAGPRLAPARRGRSAVGTRLTLTLAAPAKLSVRAYRHQPGRETGAGCQKPTKGNAKAARCTRLVPAGLLTSRQAPAGALKLSLTGRTRSGKRLTPGRYTLAIEAIDAAQSRDSLSRRVTIVRR